MRSIPLLLVLAAVALAGCGGDDSDGPAKAGSEDAAMKKDDAAMKKDEAADATIMLRDSDFGPMLVDSNRQAIYIFERDSRGRSVCYGGCAEAWPPVLTDGAPKADDGVKASLLGTIKRRDDQRQVTYAGRPLYFYAHEDLGVVLCHNVDLNTDTGGPSGPTAGAAPLRSPSPAGPRRPRGAVGPGEPLTRHDPRPPI